MPAAHSHASPSHKFAIIGSNSHSGQFLLEVIIAVAILLILAHAFITLITSSYQILSQSRSETVARALANEKLEIIRNLSFNDAGTVGGIPNGSLLQTEVISKNGHQFTIKTSIVYKDDPFDQQAPNDILPADYKTARIEVIWPGSTFPTNRSIVMVTDIAPKGVESTAGGGTIRVLVFDSLGVPVPQANVHIEAPSANPAINLDQLTDNYGNLILPGAPICTSCYHITVTKTDFSADRTYSTTGVTNPNQPPLTVLDGQLTQTSFAIDRLSTISINSVSSRETGYLNLPNISFHLQSNKTIGTDSGGLPVYKLDQDYSTDNNGQLNINLEWDAYTLTLNPNNHNLAGSNPFSPFTVTAGQNSNVGFIAVSPTNHNLLTQVQDASGSAIASASARLFDSSSYDQTIFTGDTDTPDFGQAFFSSLNLASHTLEIIHPNYQTATSSINISGETKEIVILNPL